MTQKTDAQTKENLTLKVLKFKQVSQFLLITMFACLIQFETDRTKHTIIIVLRSRLSVGSGVGQSQCWNRMKERAEKYKGIA